MQVLVKPSILAAALSLAACAALNMGWYKPGASAQEFNQDKFACMSRSQMQVNTSKVQGTGPTYYGSGNVTCNTFGSMTNCSGGGGYSQPGYVSGSSASYVTTNVPLFQACMQARGYVWTSQAEVDREDESSADEPSTTESAEPAETASSDDAANVPSVDTSGACRKLDALNKGLSAGTVTLQQFGVEFTPLREACERQSAAGRASSYDGSSGSAVDTSEACRKLHKLNERFSAGTVTQQQFDAEFEPLMNACDSSP